MLALPVADGHAPYLAWLDDAVTGRLDRLRAPGARSADDVVGVLAADADAHQAVRDAEGVTLGLRVAGVGHGGGVGDQGLDTSQALGQRAQLQPREETLRRASRTRARTRSSSRSPRPGPCGSRGRGGRETRARRPSSPWRARAGSAATRAPFSSWRGMRRARVLVPRSTSQESNGERMRARGVLHVLQPLGVLLALDHRHAAYAVGVPVQELGGGVHHDVGARARAAAGRTGS